MKTILTALLAALQAAEPSSQENGTAIQCEEQGTHCEEQGTHKLSEKARGGPHPHPHPLRHLASESMLDE
jgi:hypothetical protein